MSGEARGFTPAQDLSTRAPANACTAGARERVADLWDDVVSRWLDGDDSLPPRLQQWKASYGGRIDERWYPDPFVGDLRGDVEEPRVVILGINPGVGYSDLQARDGEWARRIRASSYSRCPNRVAFDDPAWLRLHGRNSPYWANFMRFARRWTDDPALKVPQVLNMELYPWHLNRVEGAMTPQAQSLDDFVWAPLAEAMSRRSSPSPRSGFRCARRWAGRSWSADRGSSPYLARPFQDGAPPSSGCRAGNAPS